MASGAGATPASRRAAATSCAVRRAVPEGASTLRGWCNSMISTESKYLAAFAAKWVAKTEPSAKFGAIRTPVSGCCASSDSSAATRSVSQPVVPTTAWMPCSTAKRTLATVESGTVKSTTTWAPCSRSTSSESLRPSAATNSMSAAASMAPTAAVPIRPLAPSTATFSISLMGLSLLVFREALFQVRHRPCTHPFGSAVGEELFLPDRYLGLDSLHEHRAEFKGFAPV